MYCAVESCGARCYDARAIGDEPVYGQDDALAKLMVGKTDDKKESYLASSWVHGRSERMDVGEQGRAQQVSIQADRFLPSLFRYCTCTSIQHAKSCGND